MRLLCLTLCVLFAQMTSSAAFADAVKVTDKGALKVVQIKSDSVGLGWELFYSLGQYASDPLDESKQKYTGKGFSAEEINGSGDDMDGQTYKIEFTLDPAAERLLVATQGQNVTISFEGRLASALFQGLYKRRLGVEDNYEIGSSGRYDGDYYIRTKNGAIACEYNDRSVDGLVERYAVCTLKAVLEK